MDRQHFAKPEKKPYEKRGLAVTKHHESSTTKFKLVIYWKLKPDNTPYSVPEINLKKHRKYVDSIDFILTAKGYITRHDLALNKLLQLVEKYKERMFSCLLIMNDLVNEQELLIGKFSHIEENNNFIQPLFTSYENGNVFATGLVAPAIQISELRHYTSVKGGHHER
jgi:hypothetical protein